MTIYGFEGKEPDIADSAYVAESAEVIGDVKIGEKCFVGPGAKIRGDSGRIVIGDCTSVQDNCIVHADAGGEVRIGDHVSVGHGAIVHGATVKDYAVVGMGSVVSDGSEVGRWSFLGEGAVLPRNRKIPKEKVAVGIPAEVIKDVDGELKEKWLEIKEEYEHLPRRYRKGLRRAD